MANNIPTMETYIELSPSVFEKNLVRAEELTARLVALYVEHGAGDIRLIASGSSNNACVAVRPFVERALRTRVEVYTPSRYLDEFETLERIAPHAFEIFVSQSGCSTNILEALRTARAHEHTTIALTGNVEASMSEYADALIEWGVGNETVDFVTLGVITLMEFLALFSLHAADALSLDGKDTREALASQLAQVPHVHVSIQTQVNDLMTRENRTFLAPGPAMFCGAGPAYGIALEGALKWQETLKNLAAPFEPEEYIHGPNMQLTPRSIVVLLDPASRPGRTYDTYLGTREITDHTYLVAAYAAPDASDGNVIGAAVDVDPVVAPFFLLPAVQLLSARTMRELDCRECHPLYSRFEAHANSKTDDYDAVQEQKLKAAGFAG